MVAMGTCGAVSTRGCEHMVAVGPRGALSIGWPSVQGAVAQAGRGHMEGLPAQGGVLVQGAVGPWGHGQFSHEGSRSLQTGLDSFTLLKFSEDHKES